MVGCGGVDRGLRGKGIVGSAYDLSYLEVTSHVRGGDLRGGGVTLRRELKVDVVDRDVSLFPTQDADGSI